MNFCRVYSLVSLIGLPLFAQTAGLDGKVTDASGALVPRASVTIAGPAGVTRTALSNDDGDYVIADLPSGTYTVQASAPQLIMPPVKVSLKGGQQHLNLQLRVASAKQELTVQENGGPAVSTEAAGNASALVLTGSDLDALSDNPDDLGADL